MNQQLIVSGNRIAIGGLVVHNKKIVLLRRPDNVKTCPSIWEIPSGGDLFNETLENAIIREVFEETKIQVLVGKYIGYFTYISKDDIPCIQINHICSLDLHSNLQIKISNEHICGKWVAIAETSKYKVTSEIREIIQNAFCFNKNSNNLKNL